MKQRKRIGEANHDDLSKKIQEQQSEYKDIINPDYDSDKGNVQPLEVEHLTVSNHSIKKKKKKRRKVSELQWL